MSNITPIDIPFPDAETLHLRLSIGACRLKIKPGEGSQWVAGNYDDPSNAMPLRIVQEGGTVRISQDWSWPQSWGGINRPPTFDLALGKGRPFALSLEGGASESMADLGGLPLTRLAVKYGAGRQEFDFSAPNPQALEQISVSAGAAGLTFSHLANANFAQMSVEGGAASYELDFSGVLQRDATVKINTGMASVEMRIPAIAAAKISAETVLGGLDIGDGFMKKEGAFWTDAALAGGVPLLSATVNVVMGSLRLELLP